MLNDQIKLKIKTLKSTIQFLKELGVEISDAIEARISHSSTLQPQDDDSIFELVYKKSQDQERANKIDILKDDTIPVKPENISKKQEEESKAESLQSQDLPLVQPQEVEEESKINVQEKSKQLPQTWVGKQVQQQEQQQHHNKR